MRIYRKDALAEATLREFRKLMRTEKQFRGWITPYENGREVGLVLHVEGEYETRLYGLETAYTFSEFRRSDDVVVYPGDFEKALRLSNLDKKGEKAADEMYEAKWFFRTPEEAALAIMKDLKKKAVAFRKPAAKRSLVAKG